MMENKSVDVSTLMTLDDVKEMSIQTTFIPVEKVKRGIVEVIDNKNSIFEMKSGKNIITVWTTSTTTIFFGNEEKAEMNDIDAKMKIYVFGYMRTDNSAMMATKIIIANKSRLSRL